MIKHLLTKGILIAAVFCGMISVNADELVNPFLQEGKWFKAALHVHSTTSDGDVNVPERMQQYREKKYDVVAITDHWKTNPLEGLSDDSFLVIEGMEAHPKGNHFVCLNLPEGFEIPQDIEPQAMIDMVNAAGGGVIYAHPYWLGHTIDDLLSVKGYMGIEVFNAVCELGPGKGYSSVHWDQLLSKDVIVPAVATDDVHSSQNVSIAWTMVKAKELTTKAIMDSLRSGCYYASCGPVIEDYRVEDGVAKIKCSQAALILFGGQSSYGSRIEAKDGKLLTSAEWKLPQGCKYVRAEVIDAKGNHAWVNPIIPIIPK
jgi:predicted metal-dependent phosphoesterase TrpH